MTTTTSGTSSLASDSGRRERRTQVLSHHTPSQVTSISDAVVIKAGEPFFLCPPNGQIAASGQHGFGLYHHDTRYLAGFELRIAGHRPESLVATAVTASRMELELTTGELDLGGGRTVGKHRLAVHWTRRLDGDPVRLRDQIVIESYDPQPTRIPVRLEFAVDFADIFVIRGLLDEHPGAIREPRWDGDVLRFADAGRDGVNRFLEITVRGQRLEHRDVGCDLTVDIEGRGRAQFEVDFAVREELQPQAPPIERRTGRQQQSDESAAADDDPAWPTQLKTDRIAVGSVLDRSLADLLTLRSELDGHAYYAAGVPWFSTLFGRDSLISAYQTLAFDPSVAADTLRLLAARQGTKDDAYRDEAPGRILHELRIGALARLGEIPQSPAFSSIDATPLFLIVLARHAAWTGSLALFHELSDHVDRALAWIDAAMTGNDRGYLAYPSPTTDGLVNQGWKDSGDAIVMADGTMPTPPIALAEVQGYVYAAWQGVAKLLDADGNGERAGELRTRADALQARFERDFWSDRLGCYVLALAAEGRPCEVVASNAGQVLWSGIASNEHAVAVADRLLRTDMFSGWGVRTLSTEAVAANPIGYHLGTVWPHDNSLIADGFRRYGLGDAAERIMVGLLHAATDFRQTRLPECFAGFARDAFEVPVRYPIACHPQAWAAGAFPLLLTSAAGLEPDGLDRRLRIVRPRLPAFMDRMRFESLAVGDARVDLRYTRAGTETHVEVERVEGDLAVDIEPGVATANR